MLALLATGQRKAVGVLFVCGVVTSLVDGWVVWNAGDGGKALGHVVLGAGVGLGGWGMWRE